MRMLRTVNPISTGLIAGLLEESAMWRQAAATPASWAHLTPPHAKRLSVELRRSANAAMQVRLRSHRINRCEKIANPPASNVANPNALATTRAISQAIQAGHPEMAGATFQAKADGSISSAKPTSTSRTPRPAFSLRSNPTTMVTPFPAQSPSRCSCGRTRSRWRLGSG